MKKSGFGELCGQMKLAECYFTSGSGSFQWVTRLSRY